MRSHFLSAALRGACLALSLLVGACATTGRSVHNTRVGSRWVCTVCARSASAPAPGESRRGRHRAPAWNRVTTTSPDTGSPYGGFIAPVPNSKHVVGTACMGTDPSTSESGTYPIAFGSEAT